MVDIEVKNRLGIIIMNDNIKKIQEIELDIFKEFSNICKQNNLRYFAIGGTCIGAVRHQGFIPWDDDIDVAMPYEDYIRFKNIASRELQGPLVLYDETQIKHYPSNFCKIHNKNTTYIEKIQIGHKETYTGIWIDIMPIFGLPNDKRERDCKLKKYKNYIRFNVILRSPFCAYSTTIFRALVWLLFRPISFFLPFNYYNYKIHDLFEKYYLDNSEKILFGWRFIPLKRYNTHYQCIFDTKDFKTAQNVPFEDTYISIPSGYDNYLNQDFGDYMKLPPEEDRHSTHDIYICDMDTPYTFYVEQEKRKK